MNGVYFNLPTHSHTNHGDIQKRYRDRDSHRRRDRSVDRRDERRNEDVYRPGRRDRSRERRRSRDRELGRENRRRSGERDHRERRGDSRDQARRRRDDSTDSKRRSRREETKDQKSAGVNGVKVRTNVDAKSPTFQANTDLLQPQLASARTAQTEEEKKAEKLARVEAWKQKQAAERARKQKELEAAGGTRSLLDEIDKKATASPMIVSPDSPAPASGEASPVPYAGKFDPKAIAKRATAATAALTTLGKDVALPETAKARVSATLNPSTAGLKADSSAAGLSSSTGKKSDLFTLGVDGAKIPLQVHLRYL